MDVMGDGGGDRVGEKYLLGCFGFKKAADESVNGKVLYIIFRNTGLNDPYFIVY
jgi:hypothetical protein